MDMSLSKLKEMVKDREAGRAAAQRVMKSRTRLSKWTTTNKACGILASRPGIEPASPAPRVWSLNLWTTKEVPYIFFIRYIIVLLHQGTLDRTSALWLGATSNSKTVNRKHNLWKDGSTQTGKRVLTYRLKRLSSSSSSSIWDMTFVYSKDLNKLMKYKDTKDW